MILFFNEKKKKFSKISIKLKKFFKNILKIKINRCILKKITIKFRNFNYSKDGISFLQVGHSNFISIHLLRHGI